MTRIKDLQLTKYSYENKFSVNEFLSEFDIIESRLFIKLNKSDLSKLDIIFQNKYLLDQYEILDKHKNCYVLKND